MVKNITSSPMFSFVVAIYRVEEYLDRCIQSLINQDYDDYEIILVDDGSDDGCGDICNRYSEKNKNVVVIHKNNGGLVSARKTGLKIAKGEYVINVDGDDWVMPNLLKVLYAVIKKNDFRPDVVCYDYYEGDESGLVEIHQRICQGVYIGRVLNNVRTKMLYNVAAKSLWDIRPNIWCKAIRRKTLYHYQMKVDDRISFGEDAAVVYPLFENADCIYVISDCLYCYRNNVGSMVRSYDKHLYKKTRILSRYLSDNIMTRSLKKQYYYYICIMYENLIKNELRHRTNLPALKRKIESYFSSDDFRSVIKNVSLRRFKIQHRVFLLLLKKKCYCMVSLLSLVFRDLILRG